MYEYKNTIQSLALCLTPDTDPFQFAKFNLKVGKFKNQRKC